MRITLTVYASLLALTSNAQLWKDIKRTVGSVVSTGVQIATAPTQTVLSATQTLLGNKSAEQILDPVRSLGQSAGSSVSGATSLISQPQDFLYQKAREFSQRVGGSAGSFIFDVGTFSSQLYAQMGISGAQATAQVLRGQNPLVIFGSPLAAAIRAAREAHFPNSYPLPQDVKNALQGKFSSAVLNRARYAVGNVEITLPNFIGKGAKYQEDHYAVVVDDIIVFKSSPPGFNGYGFWWAHEVTHVEQYMNWGVEVFAFNYMRDFGNGIEREADQRAATIMGTPLFSAQSQARTHDLSTTSEVFVAQCIFPNDPYPVNYMVSNWGRIIAVNPLDGTWMHVGHSMPPVFAGTAWSYQTPMFRYTVTFQGGIFFDQPIFNNWGQQIGTRPVQIGHVIRLL